MRAADLDRLSARRHKARQRAAHAMWLMRGGGSLSGAAREAGTTPATVRRYFAGSLERNQRGRWRASAADRQPFRMRITSTEGVVDRIVRGSRARSRLRAHHWAVEQFLSAHGGDPAVLAPFVGQRIGGVELETDPERLIAQARAGELALLEIYQPN